MKFSKFATLFCFMITLSNSWGKKDDTDTTVGNQKNESALLKLYGINQNSATPPLPLPNQWPKGESANSFLEFWSSLGKLEELTTELYKIDSSISNNKVSRDTIVNYLPSSQLDLVMQKDQLEKIRSFERIIREEKEVQTIRREKLAKFRKSPEYKKMMNFEIPKSYLSTLLGPTIPQEKISTSGVLRGRKKSIQCAGALQSLFESN